MSKPMTVRIGLVAAVALAVMLAGWYLLSPLFITRQVHEAPPTEASVAANEPVAMQTAIAESVPEVVDEPMPAVAIPPVAPAAPQSSPKPSAGPVLKAQGQFYNVVHDGHGSAQLFELPDGGRLLRLDDFQVLNGPDLHVYLTSQERVTPALGGTLPDSVDLGKLKGNQGSQNYPIPASVDLSKTRSVVIWCQPFRVPFIAATLASS